MDLVVRGPHVVGPVYVDFTVVSALSTEALRARSFARGGVAAGIAVRRKRASYPNAEVVTFAVEEHGRIGDEALQFVRMFAPQDPSRRFIAIRRLYQSLGTVLQRYSSDSLIAATTGRRETRQLIASDLLEDPPTPYKGAPV